MVYNAKLTHSWESSPHFNFKIGFQTDMVIHFPMPVDELAQSTRSDDACSIRWKNSPFASWLRKW